MITASTVILRRKSLCYSWYKRHYWYSSFLQDSGTVNTDEKLCDAVAAIYLELCYLILRCTILNKWIHLKRT